MSVPFLFLSSVFSFSLICTILWNRSRIIKGAKTPSVTVEANDLDILSDSAPSPIEEQKAHSSVLEQNEDVKKLDIKEIRQMIKKAEMLLAYEGEEAEAEKILVSILASDTKNVDAHILLASIFLKRKQYSRAEVLYRTLAEIEQFKNASILSNLAFCLFEQNRFDDAIHFYELARSRDKTNVKRFTNLGQVYFVIKDFENAVKMFRLASKMSPRDTEILFMLADTLREARDLKKAYEIYKKILDYEPYNTQARDEIIKLADIGIGKQ